MTTLSDLDPFEEHNKIDKEMKKLQKELMSLCEEGKYEEAEKRSYEELAPLHKKWLESLRQSFKKLKNHPNFYQPKT